MFEQTINKQTKNSLAILNKTAFIKDFYLAGGTGLALQFGHRISLDLDFFSQKEFNPDFLMNELQKLGTFSLNSKEPGTLHGVFNKTRVSFLYYPYPLMSPLKSFLNIKLADFLDIACMKIDAISSRGEKKDFIDLYFVCQKLPLNKVLDIFEQKYQKIDYNLSHVLKSLCYFEQAEKQVLPKMLTEVLWKKVKDFFIQEASNIQKDFLK